MKSYLDKAPFYFISSGADEIILEVNETICRELQYKKEELVGKKIDILFPIATKIFYQTHFFPLLRMQGHAEEIYMTLLSKNKIDIPLLLNAERIDEEGRTVLVYVGIPVHNRKKFEDELVAARKRAETALRENTALEKATGELQHHTERLDQQLRKINQQNEELRQFNRVVTHDLQEPLRKMSVFGNLLLSDYKKLEDPKVIVEKLMRAATQMRSIVSGLQQYVWLSETLTQFATVEINRLLLVVQEKLERDHPGLLKVSTDPLPPVEADWEQLHLLFHQLFSNAIRFRKPGAPAQVTITGVVLQKNQFTSMEGKYRYSDYLKLDVKDSGMGFDPQYKEQVFELFRRLHAESGHGVGLSLCKKIMDNHGGRISINSLPGGDTIVTILIPLDRSVDV